MCPLALYCCVRLCLAILCFPALDVASSSFDFEKHKLFGVYGSVIYIVFLGDFLVLKLFPGGPILDNPDFRDGTPYFHNAPEVFLIGGGGGPGFLIGGRD